MITKMLVWLLFSAVVVLGGVTVACLAFRDWTGAAACPLLALLCAYFGNRLAGEVESHEARIERADWRH